MYYFIVNPKSSSGKGLKIWNRAAQLLQQETTAYKVFFTRKAGHARVLAHELSSKYAPCTIVAVGGDGTANEVIDGLTNYEHIRFGYIPTGSGNDLARSLLLATRPEDVVRALLHPQEIRPVSIGVVQTPDSSRHFIVSSGLGYDAAICHEVNRSKLKTVLNHLRLGKLSYLAVALKLLLLLKPCRMTLTLDDHSPLTFDRVFFAAVMNMKHEGGGFMFCPDADSSDEFLDICLVEKMPKLKILTLLPTAFSGHHTRFQGIRILRCKKLRMYTDIPRALHTDGEPYGMHQELTFSLKEQQLPFIIR